MDRVSESEADLWWPKGARKVDAAGSGNKSSGSSSESSRGKVDAAGSSNKSSGSSSESSRGSSEGNSSEGSSSEGSSSESSSESSNSSNSSRSLRKLSDSSSESEATVRAWLHKWHIGANDPEFKLSAYCSFHQDDTRIPHVYPLRVLGVLPNQLNWTLPCPFWSCIMTEVENGGKLWLFASIGAASVLNFIHYRCDCMKPIANLLGAGQPRQFWWWFWATMLPVYFALWMKTITRRVLGAMLIETVQGAYDAFNSWFITGPEREKHLIELLVLLVVSYVVWYYRWKILSELGLDECVIPMIMKRNEVHDGYVITFQLCVWRVDVSSERDDQGSSDQDEEGGYSLRSMLSGGTPRSQRRNNSRNNSRSSPRTMLPYLPIMPMLFSREESDSVLSTTDGSVPSISVHLHYGTDEIQRTRVVKPTHAEWWHHEPIYFQEMFKVSFPHSPGSVLRVEIRDASALPAPIALSHVRIKDEALMHAINKSKHALKNKGKGPSEQVVQMNLRPDPVDNTAMLENVGFSCYKLSDGGAVWLAISDFDEQSTDLPGCCLQ